MSDNTYGSFGLRCGRLRDTKGEHMKNETLHLHIYDCWTNFHHSHKKFLWYYEILLSKLERHIGTKWKKILSYINAFLKDWGTKTNLLIFRIFQKKEESILSRLLNRKRQYNNFIYKERNLSVFDIRRYWDWWWYVGGPLWRQNIDQKMTIKGSASAK